MKKRRTSRQVAFHWAAMAALVPLMISGWLAYEVAALQRSAEAMQSSALEARQSAEVATEIMGRGIQVGAGSAHVDGTEMAPTAWGTLYYAPAQTDGVLVVGGLPNPPGDQCYQLWLISGEKWMDGGTFYPEDSGKGMLIVKSPMPLASIDTIRVTMEPHGGSPQPRGNRYMWARLQSI